MGRTGAVQNTPCMWCFRISYQQLLVLILTLLLKQEKFLLMLFRVKHQPSAKLPSYFSLRCFQVLSKNYQPIQMVIRALRMPLEYPLQPTKPSVDDGVISTGICIWKRLFIRLQIIDIFIRMDFLELKLCTNDKNSLFQKIFSCPLPLAT